MEDFIKLHCRSLKKKKKHPQFPYRQSRQVDTNSTVRSNTSVPFEIPLSL